MGKREDNYITVRESKRKHLKQSGAYACIFCSKPLPLTDEGVDCHHLIGRDNDNISEERYLTFAHHECHMQYHYSPTKPGWWHHFSIKIQRLYPEISIRKKWM